MPACKKSGCPYVRALAETGIYKISGKPVCKGLFFSKAKCAINQQDKNVKENLLKKLAKTFGSFTQNAYLCTRNQEMNATQV